MRRIPARLTGLAAPLGTAAAALLFSALSAGPAAAGTGYGQLIVNPGTVAPGQSVSVLGTCPNNGSSLTGVYSSAFVGGSATVTRSSINFSGTAMIAPDASGQYTVKADCGSGSPTVTITVSGSMTGTHPATTPPANAPSPVHSTYQSMPMQTTTSTGAGAIVGGVPTQHSTTPAPAKSSAAGMGTGGAQAMGATPGNTAAGNGPVTSTGIVRVGLAGSSHSAMTTAGAAAIAAAVALAGGVGFLVIRRRRNTPGSHI